MVGRIFIIWSDYQVLEERNNYTAIGSGRDLALGAFYALRKEEMLAKDRVRMALEAAEKFNNAVHRPFKILTLPYAPV